MDIRQLEYFLAVVDRGGFNRAASALYVSQRSLSQAVRALERDLGTELLHRIGRRAVLTDVGRALIESARAAVRSLEVARASVAAAHELREGGLDIAAMPSQAVEPFTTLIRSFAERYPGVAVAVKAAFTARDVIDAVRTGAVELGLLASARAVPDAEVRAHVLGEQRFVLVSPPGAPSPAARRGVRGADGPTADRGTTRDGDAGRGAASKAPSRPESERRGPSWLRTACRTAAASLSPPQADREAGALRGQVRPCHPAWPAPQLGGRRGITSQVRHSRKAAGCALLMRLSGLPCKGPSCPGRWTGVGSPCPRPHCVPSPADDARAVVVRLARFRRSTGPCKPSQGYSGLPGVRVCGALLVTGACAQHPLHPWEMT
ncbi:LysR family transcriptional regulator [Streptomyces sp. NPDC052016]|uniref:LysR family transcriptional regulator n=1 Tax=Streptomyces sp. NPDC052016 TaxID=3365680 RepID=UPI0037D5C04A